MTTPICATCGRPKGLAGLPECSADWIPMGRLICLTRALDAARARIAQLEAQLAARP